MKAYVFVTVGPGKSTDVAGRLRALEGVKSVDVCWGVPDIIILVEAADLKSLQDAILNQIQNVAEVDQTDTHIVLEA